jgi:hypothetical protein
MAPFTKGNPGGPGRPKKADKYKGKIERAEKQIADRLPDLIDNLFELANGVLVAEVNPVTGETNVYRKPPDYKANEYLINRIMGKPTERLEASGPDGGPIPLEHAVPDEQVGSFVKAFAEIQNYRGAIEPLADGLSE